MSAVKLAGQAGAFLDLLVLRACVRFTPSDDLPPSVLPCTAPYRPVLQAQDFRIQYDSIVRVFLLPKANVPQTLVVISLDPPIRKGQTFYNHILCQVSCGWVGGWVGCVGCVGLEGLHGMGCVCGGVLGCVAGWVGGGRMMGGELEG